MIKVNILEYADGRNDMIDLHGHETFPLRPS